MATSEERRLQARIDALGDELDSRKSNSQRQSDLLTGSGRNELDEERASDTSQRQARRAVRGSSRGWRSEESPYVEPSREDAYRAFERQQIRRDNGADS